MHMSTCALETSTTLYHTAYANTIIFDASGVTTIWLSGNDLPVACYYCSLVSYYPLSEAG